MSAVLARAQRLGLIGEAPHGAVDATGLEVHHASGYYEQRRGPPLRHRPFAKVTVVCETDSYLWVGVAVRRGPSNDSPDFGPAVRDAAGHLAFEQLMADGAYDVEANHRLCREELGIPSTVIPINPRRYKAAVPQTTYRREMHDAFPRAAYGQRWHVESSFSQHKRVLGSVVRSRSPEAHERECWLRVLTHDLMILRSSLPRFSTEHCAGVGSTDGDAARVGHNNAVVPRLAGGPSRPPSAGALARWLHACRP